LKPNIMPACGNIGQMQGSGNLHRLEKEDDPTQGKKPIHRVRLQKAITWVISIVDKPHAE